MDIDREAEQATIGAILLDPDRYEDVREWLEPEDFDGLRERAAYAAIVTISSDDRTPTPDAVHRHLQDAAARDGSPMQPDGVFLADCIHVCPVPSRAATYGRMVLELCIRRQIATGAAALQQRAASATTSNDLTLVFARVDMLRRDIEDLHRRETIADGSLSPVPIEVTGLPPVPGVTHRRDVMLERRVVAGLTERPDALGTVESWLRPGDFVDAASATVYSHLLEMRSSGVGIDRLTLDWSLSHSEAGPPAVGRVRSASTDPVTDAREVLRVSVTGVVHATAVVLRVSASTRTGREADITAVAYQRLNDLWPEQRRTVAAQYPRMGGEPLVAGRSGARRDGTVVSRAGNDP